MIVAPMWIGVMSSRSAALAAIGVVVIVSWQIVRALQVSEEESC